MKNKKIKDQVDDVLVYIKKNKDKDKDKAVLKYVEDKLEILSDVINSENIG